MIQGSSGHKKLPEKSLSSLGKSGKVDGRKLTSTTTTTVGDGNRKDGKKKENENSRDFRDEQQMKREPVRDGDVTRATENRHHDNRLRRPDKGTNNMATMTDRRGGVEPPTPPIPQLPPPPIDQRIPPYFGFSPYLSSRRTPVIDSGYPFLYPHVPYPFNPPLPVNSNTNEGHYHWPPSMPYHPSADHGTGTSPTFSDLSPRSPFGGEPVSGIGSRLQWEQYQKAATLQYNPFAFYHHRFSPNGLAAASGYHRDGGYLAAAAAAAAAAGEPLIPPSIASLSHRSMFSEHPASIGSGSITIPGSLDGSRLASSRPSVLCKGGRKRALSHSPIEFGLDIESLTRSSEGSLHLPAFGHGSRASSNGSGSYGHLSAASLTALAAASNHLTNPFFRHGGMPISPFCHPMLHPGMFPWSPPVPGPGNCALASASSDITSTAVSGIKLENQRRSENGGASTSKEPGTGIVSSTVHNSETLKSKLKKEEYSPVSDLLSEELKRSPDLSHIHQDGELDFYETHCHWRGCSQEFDTQEELVKHLNQDHITTNKKLYVCQWIGCERKEKPFKAQYMLVVHMRRHTGEKPHRCSFEGCHKAYSRLENLKTHLRSHTGEKPYMCEYQGCTKAFSNASDRAKHQNRTHSNAKPYTCKAPGCTKCYTDPSSLRKHVKTVHGADFYANKKHKGDSCHENDDVNGYHGHRGTSVKTVDVMDDRKPDLVNSNSNHSNDSSSSSSKVEDSLAAPSIHHPSPSTDRNQITDSEASLTSPQSLSSQSVQSPPDDGLLQQALSACQQGAGGLIRDAFHHGDSSSASHHRNINSSSEHLPTDEEAGVDFALPVSGVAFGHESAVGMMSGVVPRRSKVKLHSRSKCGSKIPTLPPLGPNSRRVNSADIHPKFTDIRPKTINKKTLIETMASRDTVALGRDGSNASTPSSYMSSIRSDASPCSFSARLSRHPSETSTNSASQRSMPRSPYEYDFGGSATNVQHHSLESSLGAGGCANISALTSRMERTKLDGSGLLLGGVVSGEAYPYGRGSITRFLAASSQRESCDSGIRTNTCASTPCHTPLPQDIPHHDVRRASDPSRWAAAATDEAMLTTHRPFQRCHSLNGVRPLPIPPKGGRGVARRSPASVMTLMSSHSSVATNVSSNQSFDADYDATFFKTEDDAVTAAPTAPRAPFDCDDLIIPDEMQDFLDQTSAAAAAERGDSTADSTMSDASRLVLCRDVDGKNVVVDGDGPRSSCMYEKSRFEDDLATWNEGAMHRYEGLDHGGGRRNNPSACVNLAAARSTNGGAVPYGYSTDMAPPPPPLPQSSSRSLEPGGNFSREPPAASGRYQTTAVNQSARFGSSSLLQSGEEPRLSSQWYRSPQPHQGRMGVASRDHFQQCYNNNSNNHGNRGMQYSAMTGPTGMGPPWGGHNRPGPAAQQFVGNSCPSPHVQVPQISQSQTSPRTKVPNSRMNPHATAGSGAGGQSYQRSHSQAHQLVPFYHHPSGYYQWPPAMAVSQQGQMHHWSLQNHNQQQQQPGDQFHVGAVNHQHHRQGNQCSDAGFGVQGPSRQSNMAPQMSPSCNQVTSTSDLVPCFDDEGPMQVGVTLTSINSGSFMDNLSSISVDNLPPLSPTMLTDQAETEGERQGGGGVAPAPYNNNCHLPTSYLNTCNMVVNDMSSVLTQLFEENKYLGIQG